jgi:outer membrane protein assembly factor BamA
MPDTKLFSSFFCKISFFFIILFFNLIINTGLSAIEIKRIEIIGSTIELDMKEYIKNIKGDLSRKDIEAIGVKVTYEYHEMGYTTSYVEKLTVRDNGLLEIHIKESKILGVNITGISGKEKNGIELLFNSLTGNIYNKYKIEKKAASIKREHNLEAVQIYPINYGDSADVFLSIKLTKKSAGNFYGGIGFEPIYGISPYLGYYHPFTDTALDLYAKAGYREGKFRKAEGDIKFFLFPDNDPRGFYIGSNAAMYLERWESRGSDYRRISLSPVLGYRVIYQYLILDFFANEIISDIENYKDTDNNKSRDYDSRITLELGFSNRADLLLKKDATDIKLSVSSGKSDLFKKYYLISSGEFKSTIAPFAWLRIKPALYSYYTTSDERFYWQYVYDKRLLGFFNDYTASKWKSTAGLDFEFEIVPQFFYSGPFINTGYFLDESLDWQSRTGGGLMGVIEFTNSYIGVYFAWDLSKGPSKGGLSILAGGTF